MEVCSLQTSLGFLLSSQFLLLLAVPKVLWHFTNNFPGFVLSFGFLHA